MAKQQKLKDKDFLAELAGFAQQQREMVEAECSGFATDYAARDIRRTRAQNDFRFFSRTYFPHYVRSDESVFQGWFYDTVPGYIDQPRGFFVNVSAPRGNAKSTLGTQLFTLWCVVTGRKWFIPIVMDSIDQAAPMLESIKVELESNPRLAMDFPEACGVGRVWNVGVILTKNGRKVQAFGSGKKMRGLRHGAHRPDLVMLDDIENDENVRSKDQRDKLEAWLTKVVIPLGPPDGTMDIVYLNTILHYDSVANRTHAKPLWKRHKFKAVIKWPDRMDLWEKWEELFINEGEEEADAHYAAHRAAMDKGAVVTWPSMQPLVMLMKKRAGDHHAFDCEYQNDPTSDNASFFDKMQFWVQPSRDWVFYGAHDPSLGKQNKSRDPSATLVGGFDRNHGILSVVEAIVARRVPSLQIAHIIEFQKQYCCMQWAFEAVQFQEFMRQQLVTESAKLFVPVPARPVTPHNDKDLRIESLSPHVANGLILFYQAHTVLNSQLRHWPEADHDDGPDALEMLWKLCLSGASGIPKFKTGPRKGKKK
jgi:predicted phage terminase large subunit-like protein